ncbi:hypothetical protein ABRP77_07790 [Pectobacterium odoriferum]|uniref:hypothetical protein n=1 Tax=Pectobacterium odoriferum TaxID=78398 RepID=UPI0032ED41B6
MKSFNEWLNEARSTDGYFYRNRRVICSDGFSISIQANEAAYCSPRENIEDIAEYNSFELGFPSAKDNQIMEYSEDAEDPTGTVYGYVPRELVEKLIESHGGISELKQRY